MTATTSTALATIVREFGGEALPENAQWKNRFTVRSETSTREYIIAQRKSESREWACSCMGWIRYRHCKHLDAVRPALADAARRGVLA